MSTQKLWETVYETKTPDQVSWTQKVPQTSLDFITSFGLDKSAKIIDIGGGDSNLVDYLLDLGFHNISVLDISAKALERAKNRLGEKGKFVTWIHSDIVDFKPTEKYDIWHDRAAFHFLTTESQIKSYANLTKQAVNQFMVVGTFSEEGPLKCSGLEISQYNAEKMDAVFNENFTLLLSKTEDHFTPFDTVQNFLFCSFKRNSTL
ncbi:MAG: class I SAM-dependent methyltransferase [Crocinitomicaceae bacterium]